MTSRYEKLERRWLVAAWAVMGIIFIVAIGVSIVSFERVPFLPVGLPSGPRMVLPFTEVEGFGYRAYLLVPALLSEHRKGGRPGILYLSCYDHLGKQIVSVIEKREVPFDYDYWQGFITVKPDNSAFYVGTEKQLLEYDSNVTVKRRIPISEFSFGSTDERFEFGGAAVASDDRLWFTVRKLQDWSQHRKSYSTFVAEWNLKEPPSRRSVGGIGWPSGGIVVDPEKRRVYGFSGSSSPVEVFNFEKGQPERLFLGNWGFVDFDKKQGLLLSQTCVQNYGEKAEIVRMDAEGKAKVTVTHGFTAVWGSDGYVYFCDGYKELCRCRPDGSDRQSVYIAEEGDIVPRASYPPPKVSCDRTLLAFDYSLPDRAYGTVHIDLKQEEYIEIPGAVTGYDRMAWLHWRPAGQSSPSGN
jgi:hypothetical protein